MEFPKHKLLFTLIIAAFLVAAVVWFVYPKSYITQEKLKQWVSSGYAQQFCKVIYPRVAKCVKFSAKQCDAIVRAQIEGCIAKGTTLPSRADQAQAREIYSSFAQCFQNGVRDNIVQQYLVNSPECQKIFS